MEYAVILLAMVCLAMLSKLMSLEDYKKYQIAENIEIWAALRQLAKIIKEQINLGEGLSRDMAKISGLLTKLTIEAKVSKETSSRAFNMASSSQVCIAALQSAITRKPKGYNAQIKEAVASKKIDEELGGEDVSDFLYAVMTDEEREKIEKTRKYFNAGI